MVGWWLEWDGREQKVGRRPPPEEKAASRKKSRLRRKKTAAIACRIVSCVSRVACSYLWILATTDLRGSSLWFRRSPSCASGFAFDCMVNHNTLSPMAGLLHIEIAGVVRRVRRVMRMLSALFPRLLLPIRASQGGVMRDWCYAISDGRAAPRLPLQEVKSRSHRSLEHNLRNRAKWISASKVKHCNLRGRGASRGRGGGSPGGRSHDATRGRTTRRSPSYSHGARGATH